MCCITEDSLAGKKKKYTRQLSCKGDFLKTSTLQCLLWKTMLRKTTAALKLGTREKDKRVEGAIMEPRCFLLTGKLDHTLHLQGVGFIGFPTRRSHLNAPLCWVSDSEKPGL